jgi:hypothetical protein
VIAQVLIKRVIRAAAGGVRSGVRDDHQLLRVLHRQQLEQHRIHQTEDRRVGPNAKRESDNRGQREAGFVNEYPDAITNVLPEIAHGFSFIAQRR